MTKKLLTIVLSLYGTALFAHGGIDHKKAQVVHTPEQHEKIILSGIGEDYKTKIEPILKGKCFDCHSNQTTYPWYYKIPGIQSLMNSHIEEARSHLDFSKGYPFISHVKPIEDLKAIQKSVDEDKMPPLYYRVLHANMKVTPEEKKQIRDWVESSLKKMQ